MLLEQRIGSFVELRNHLFLDNEFIARVQRGNPWFTTTFVSQALQHIRDNYLEEQKMRDWVASYSIPENIIPKKVGVIAAGNIPLVSIQDILCVLLSGHTLVLKISEKDNILPLYVIDVLRNIDSKWKDKIVIAEQLKDVDAIIATGSNNSSRYFEYYFSKYPHIIRKNRNSVALITGNETHEQLLGLADDICMYFGMGCRNVTHLYVPQGYNFLPLVTALEKYAFFIDHHRYKSNLDYYRTIKLMNLIPILAIDFLNISENQGWKTAISDLNFSYYKDVSDVLNSIAMNRDQLQCMAASEILSDYTVPFGTTQFPTLTQYPDDIDIMDFLIRLS